MYHPHLLRILSWSVEPGKWVCCELFDANLFKYIHRQGPWVVKDYFFTKVLSPIASAVAFLHGKNFVHKDINSHHVLFLEDFSRVVLSGHNMSKSLSDSKHGISSAKRGECHWMDPECYVRKYCMESDVYSLGVILGELLTGEQPYDGESHGRVILKQKTGEPPFHLSHDIRQRWPRVCQLYYHCTSTRGGLNGDRRRSYHEEDAMMTETDAENEEDVVGLIRPRAQELAEALLAAVDADNNDAENNSLSNANANANAASGNIQTSGGGDALMDMDIDHDTVAGAPTAAPSTYEIAQPGGGLSSGGAVVVDRVYNSHKVKNRRNKYSNCVVQ